MPYFWESSVIVSLAVFISSIVASEYLRLPLLPVVLLVISLDSPDSPPYFSSKASRLSRLSSFFSSSVIPAPSKEYPTLRLVRHHLLVVANCWLVRYDCGLTLGLCRRVH